MATTKFKKVSIVFVAVMALNLLGAQTKMTELNTFSEEKSLNFKTCVTVQLGFDYLLAAFEKIFDQYANRFNMQFEEQHQVDHPQKKSTFQDNIFAGNLHFKVNRDIEWQGDQLGQGKGGHAFINYTKSNSDNHLVIGVPFIMEPIERVFNIHTKEEMQEVIIKGTIEFQILIDWEGQKEVEEGSTKKKEGRVPRLWFHVNKRIRIHRDRGCKYHPRYCQIVSDLENNFVNRFITLNDERFFDHVSSARTLRGLMNTFNNLARRHAFSNLAQFDRETKNINLVLGCTQEQV